MLARGRCASRPDRVAVRRAHNDAAERDNLRLIHVRKVRQLLGKAIRKPFVVIVKEGHPVASSRADPYVAGFATAQGTFVDEVPHTLVGLGAQNLHGCLVRTVHNDDRLPVAHGLALDTP